MNVLQVYKTRYPAVEGGVDVVVGSLLRPPAAQYHGSLLRTADWTERRATRSEIGGVTVYALHLPLPARGRAWLAFLWRAPAALRALKRILRDAAIDVVHLHTLQHYHLYFVVLRWLGGPPFVVTLHRAEVLAYVERSPLTRWIWRRTLQDAAAVVAVASWLAELARRTFSSVAAIDVVENGVELPAALPDGKALRAGLGLPARYCIMIGTCQPYKGHATALRAWAQLSARFEDVALVIVGTGELLPHYRALAAELGIAARLYLTGHLPHAEALALVRDSLALVMPSRSEGMSLALLEAGAAGVPLICSDIDAFRQLIEPERTALVFAVDDAAGLAHAVERVLDDEQLRERLASSLAEHVGTRYPVARMCEQYARIYRDVFGLPCMNKPNLFIVGAMKAGTRTLHTLLAQHPQVFMCNPGEPSHFVDGGTLSRIWPMMHRQGYWADEGRYLALFDAAGAARIIGESSTNYAKLPWVPGVVERIRAFAPQARIIYLMREPVARAISHYWHAVERDGEMREPGRALGEPGIYADVSHYAMQLQPYLTAFGRSNVYTLTIEEFDARPAQSYRALLEWLDVDPGFAPVELGRRYHVRAAEIWQPRAAWLARCMNRYAVLDCVNRHTRPLEQYYFKRVLMRRIDTRTVDLRGASAFLRQLSVPQIGELEDLLGRRFPEWQR